MTASWLLRMWTYVCMYTLTNSNSLVIHSVTPSSYHSSPQQPAVGQSILRLQLNSLILGTLIAIVFHITFKNLIVTRFLLSFSSVECANYEFFLLLFHFLRPWIGFFSSLTYKSLFSYDNNNIPIFMCLSISINFYLIFILAGLITTILKNNNHILLFHSFVGNYLKYI